MMLTDLADACRRSGLQVREHAGWRTRGKGQMKGVRTIVAHHDVSPANRVDGATNYVRDNVLSQLSLGRDGTVHVLAAGLCWHAGVVHQADQGNAYAIGIEAAHTGDPRDPWPPLQYDAYARLCAALVKHYGLTVSRVQGHKEVARPTGRKSDPTFDMSTFRRDVARHLSGAGSVPTPAPTTPEDDVVTPADRTAIAKEAADLVWAKALTYRGTNREAGWLLTNATDQAVRAHAAASAVDPNLLTTAVAAGIAAAGNSTDVNALARAIVLELGKQGDTDAKS